MYSIALERLMGMMCMIPRLRYSTNDNDHAIGHHDNNGEHTDGTGPYIILMPMAIAMAMLVTLVSTTISDGDLITTKAILVPWMMVMAMTTIVMMMPMAMMLGASLSQLLWC